MIIVGSQQQRVIIGRLERGVDLIQGLVAVCASRQVRCGWVTALGALEEAEVTHYDVRQKKYRVARSLAGPLEILSLTGNLSENQGELAVHVHVTLSREGDNGIEVLGGHLVTGRVFALEFSITALDDALLRRGRDKGTGLALWQEGFEADPPEAVEPAGPGAEEDLPTPEASAPAPAETDAAPSWQDVMALSKEQPVATPPREREPPSATEAVAPPPPPALLPLEEDEEEEPEGEPWVDLSPGDIIEHPRLGRCSVQRIEGADEYAQVRLRNGNLVRLSLDIVTLSLVGHEQGHQVFKAEIES